MGGGRGRGERKPTLFECINWCLCFFRLAPKFEMRDSRIYLLIVVWWCLKQF